MVSWIIIGILVILAFFVVKMRHVKHKFTLVFIIILALFFYFSFSLVSKHYNLDFSSTNGFSKSLKVYFGWLANGFHNLKDITGNVVNMDWKSANGSIDEFKLKSGSNSTYEK
jgi:hypothetical protein